MPLLYCEKRRGETYATISSLCNRYYSKREEKKKEKEKGETNATVSLLYYVNSQLHEVVTRLCSRYCKGRVLQGSSEYCYC